MVLTLSYQLSDGSTRRNWVQSYQRLTVGSSMYSDLVCEFDCTMESQHFQVVCSDGDWVIRPFQAVSSRSSPQLFVNDLPVNNWEQRLCDGDIVQAGQTRFLIDIEGAGRLAAKESACRPAEVEPSKADPLRWWYRSDCPICLEVQCPKPQIPSLLQSLASSHRMVACVNNVRLGCRMPGVAIQGEDMFSSAPEEIRSSDSLHLAEVSSSSFASLCEPLADACRRDAASLLVTDRTCEQLCTEMKLAWAWYARPQQLSFHLTHGSQQLVQMLLSQVRHAVVWDRESINQIKVFGLSEGLQQCEQRLREFSKN